MTFPFPTHPTILCVQKKAIQQFLESLIKQRKTSMSKLLI